MTDTATNVVGLVFAYKDASNYWAVEQAGGFGIWTVVARRGGHDHDHDAGWHRHLLHRRRPDPGLGHLDRCGVDRRPLQTRCSGPPPTPRSWCPTPTSGSSRSAAGQYAGPFTASVNALAPTPGTTLDGRPTKVSAPSNSLNGQFTLTSYDPDGNVTAVTDKSGTTTVRTQQTGFDDAEQMVSQTDGASHATTYSYDPLGRLAATATPLSGTTTATPTAGVAAPGPPTAPKPP